MKRRPRNFETPWGPLSYREAQVMDALIKHGSHIAVAKQIHLSNKSIATYYARVKERMGMGAPGVGFLPILMWDRWRRGEDVVVSNGEYWGS